MSPRIVLFALLATLLCPALSAQADTASDIAALKAAVASLQQTVASQQTQINALKSVTSGFTRVTDTTRTDGKKGTELFLTGFNLHVVNGLGATNGNPGTGTDTTTHVNGLGNVVIGYNSLRASSADTNVRTGSHNLVVGDGQNYSSYAGILGGIFNTASGAYASVPGGYRNTASGFAASTTGGNNNLASGAVSSVNGGGGNQATAYFSTVSGGQNLVEDAQYGWAAGGYHTP